MKDYKEFKRQINAEEGSFLLRLRCDLNWDWVEFKKLTAEMLKIAKQSSGDKKIEKWIAHGFWFCDTWIKEFTVHEKFPKPEKVKYDRAIEIISDLAYYFFMNESPYLDNSLDKKIEELK